MESYKNEKKLWESEKVRKKWWPAGWKSRLIVISFVMAAQAFLIYFSFFQALGIIEQVSSSESLKCLLQKLRGYHNWIFFYKHDFKWHGYYFFVAF